MFDIQNRVDVNADRYPNPMRVAIVGFGRIALAWMEAIRLTPGVMLAGFSTSDARIRAGNSSHLELNLGLKGYYFQYGGMHTAVQWQDLVNRDDIDMFIICAPTSAHEEIAVAIAKRGKHCIIEKPVATTAAEGKRIQSAFAGSAGRVAVGHVLPAFPEYNFLCGILRDRKPKDVRALELKRHVSWDSVFTQEGISKTTGFAPDLGVHDLNLVLHWVEHYKMSVIKKSEWHFDKPQRLIFSPYCFTSFPDTSIILDVGADRHCSGFKHSWSVELKDGDTYWFDGSAVWHYSPVFLSGPQKVDIAALSVAQIFAHELQTAVSYFLGDTADCDFLDLDIAVRTLEKMEIAVKKARSGTEE